MQDRAVVMMVVGFLGVVALGAMGLLTVLLLHDKNVSDAVLLLFSNLAVGAVGAIGGLLANTHTSPPNLPTVEVPVADPPAQQKGRA